MIRTLTTCALLLTATAAQAELTVDATRYTCERGVEVPVVYVNDDTPEDGIAVIQVEGGMFNLLVEQSASGARYGFPSDGSHYIWWSKGDTAQLLWHDGETGEDVSVYEDCTRAN
jgi:membrane-bound inhibitor of C-type lysozyme